MDINATKIELMDLILKTEDKNILKKLQQVLKEEVTDWWEELSSEEREEVELGIKQADQKKFVSDSEISRLFEKCR